MGIGQAATVRVGQALGRQDPAGSRRAGLVAMALGVAFIRAAAGMLTPSGQLWLVANRHLPYEKAMETLFRDVAEIGGTAGFKVLRALRPAAAPRPAR